MNKLLNNLFSFSLLNRQTTINKIYLMLFGEKRREREREREWLKREEKKSIHFNQSYFSTFSRSLARFYYRSRKRKRDKFCLE